MRYINWHFTFLQVYLLTQAVIQWAPCFCGWQHSDCIVWITLLDDDDGDDDDLTIKWANMWRFRMAVNLLQPAKHSVYRALSGVALGAIGSQRQTSCSDRFRSCYWLSATYIDGNPPTARRFFKTRQLQLSPVLVLGICVWGLMVSHHSWRRITAILYKRIRRISGSILTRKSKAFTLNESVIERGRKTLTIFGLEIVVSPKRYTREDQSCHWSLKV